MLRNIAIIAHVDHGKTTLVDGLLAQAGTFAAHEEVADRVMDSMDLEKERGITILAKNTAIQVGDVKINIVDTPGHADFGGEVERVLKMVDGLSACGCLRSPLPQTRFVLKSLGSRPSDHVCINKSTDPTRIQEVENRSLRSLHRFGCRRGPTPDYDHACERVVPDQSRADLKPLFTTIIDFFPEPTGNPASTLQFLVTQLDYDSYVGRLAIGRIVNGSLKQRDELLLCGEEGDKKVKINQLYTWKGLRRTETTHAEAGEIIAIAGISDLNIGDTLTAIDDPQPLPRTKVDEPTIGITILANTSPFSGREGKYVTARQSRERRIVSEKSPQE